MTQYVTRGLPLSLKRLSTALLLGAALGLAALPALAEDATTPAPAAEAPAAAAPASEAPAAPTPDTVVATVGEQSITEADLAFAAEDLAQELQQMQPADRRAFLVTVLIDMKVMAKAAKDAGMDQADIFKRRLQYLEERALRRAYFADKIAASVTEPAINAAYDKLVADFQPVEEVHARHILVATKEEAEAVKADLDAGKPFEVEAMAKTTDPSGKTNGGDLGFFRAGQMVPEFETAAFALEPGQVSEPVQSQFGWHVIKLEEKRLSSPPPLAQVQQQLSQQVVFQAFDDELAKLKQGVTIAIPDAELAAGVKRQSEPEPAE